MLSMWWPDLTASASISTCLLLHHCLNVLYDWVYCLSVPAVNLALYNPHIAVAVELVTVTSLLRLNGLCLRSPILEPCE